MKHKVDQVVTRKQAVDSVDRQYQFSAQLLPQVMAGVRQQPVGATSPNRAARSNRDEAIPILPGDDLRARIQIYWSYNHFQTLPERARVELVESLAGLIGAEAQSRTEHLAYFGQTALDWTVSPAAVERLRQLAASNASSFQALPLDTILLEHKNGEVEAWFVAERGWQRWQPADGSRLISLLDRGFDAELLLEALRAAYWQARYLALREPSQAIRLCKSAIEQLEPTRYLGTLASSTFSPVNLASLLQPQYSRGLFYLLLASINLNKGLDLRQVEEYYLIGRDEFLASGQFFYLALADLGQAVALRRIGELDDARDVYLRAQELLQHESRPSPAMVALRQAVGEEATRVEARIVLEALLPASKKAALNVFNVGTGARIAAQRGNADLHFFCRKDYQAYEQPPHRTFSLALARLAQQTAVDFGAVTYILEIPRGFSTDGSLQPGDWVLIAGEIEPERLHHKQVVVLEDDLLHASIKTFFNEARDHFFLKAGYETDTSFVVENYGASAEAIEKYYQKYKKSGLIEYRAAYEVCLSGAVVGLIRQGHIVAPSLDQAVDRHAAPVIRQIPLVARISAGLGVIEQAEVNEQWYLPEHDCAGATFGLIVEGDSMAADGIHSGDIALIRQQAAVQQGEIAAVVIWTPDKTLEVIKAYHVFDRPGQEHWFLRSSHRSARHVVVIPAGVDPWAVKRLYHNRMSNVVFLSQAELWVAGKYIKKISAATAR